MGGLDPTFAWPSLSHRLLIVGASARAAAESAARAGFEPICADMFGDVDLRRVARVLHVEDYPCQLPSAVESVPRCPWIYTGALENHPKIVAEISRHRPLWGNPPEVLQRVRDPFHIHQVLQAANLPTLAVRQGNGVPPKDGRWILKPRRGAGGRGIKLWDRHSPEIAPRVTEDYFQEKCHGIPISAVFVAMPTETWLVGITRQLVGSRRSNALPFAYCGSVGPLTVHDTTEQTIRHAGVELAKACGLRGLFGCDFVMNGCIPFLVEVNPRYTASVEVLEQALHVPLLLWHGRACVAFDSARAGETSDGMPCSGFPPPAEGARLGTVGKQVLYADKDIVVPSCEQLLGKGGPNEVPRIADVPAAGTHIRCGDAICTVLAAADELDGCLQILGQSIFKAASHFGVLESTDSAG